MKYLPLIALALLAGCTAAQIEDATAKVATACQNAAPLANQAIGIPTVGPFIAVGVLVVCGSDAAIAKAAQDPSTALWLDQQAAMLKHVIHP